MKLFTADLYRNFGIGFAAGAALVVTANGAAIVAAVPQFFAALF